MNTAALLRTGNNHKYHSALRSTSSVEKGFKWSDCCKSPVGNALLWTITTIILTVAFYFEGMNAFAVGMGGARHFLTHKRIQVF